MQIKHTKVSAVADSGDASLVQPSDWNDEHQITAPFQRYYPDETPNGSIHTFHFAAAADASRQFQLFLSGILQNEGDDYSIAIGASTTTVTMVLAPLTGQQVIAYF